MTLSGDAFPIIRLEVAGMKHSILTQYAAQLDEEAAVEDFCTPENVALVVKTEVARVIDSAIRGEVEAFYRHGPGREVVKKVVVEALTPK